MVLCGVQNRDFSGTQDSSLLNILNGKNSKMIENTASPSQLDEMKPAPRVGFRFLTNKRDMKGTWYRKAKIYRGGKKWFVYYYYYHDGKFNRYKVYEDLNRQPPEEKEAYALDLRDAVNEQLRSGFNPLREDLTVVVRNWSVIQGLNFFKTNLPNRGLRKRTIQSYESVLRFLYEYFPAHTPIKELSKIQVNAIFRQAYLKKKWSNVTFNNYIMFTRAIWNYLIEEEVTDNNPIKVKPLPEQITKHKYFSDEVFKKIKENAPADLLRFIMFLYHTGTRPNEARQLKYDNILRDRKLLFIPASISKNKKDDYVPLTDYILKEFKGEGLIFGTSVNYFTQKWTKLKKDLKLDKDYTLYSIKSTRAIHLANDKADPYTIMRLFRHSGLHVTMSYLRDLNVDINREAVEKGIKF